MSGEYEQTVVHRYVSLLPILQLYAVPVRNIYLFVNGFGALLRTHTSSVTSGKSFLRDINTLQFAFKYT
jgi:hypothetical protein